MPSVKYGDLELAMHFASAGDMLDAGAYISRETAKIFWESDDGDLEDETSEDFSDRSLYAEVPSPRDLDLGKPLVLKIAADATGSQRRDGSRSGGRLSMFSPGYSQPEGLCRFRDAGSRGSSTCGVPSPSAEV